ncbi:uncharacterized protein LOC131022877 [Salvia miltiorrhiza]|uniref:uncharacterized protein LOC131022877 n=1 Tax=Salvia miltiorrhiza TaxID=226208 RepID=UPI0025AD0023|nr:uncharacterized protein LOC131022877 [Salvia miltiorrhiza]
MAALSLGHPHLCHHKHKPLLLITTATNPRMIAIVSCQNRNPDNEKTDKGAKEDKGIKLQKVLFGVEKIGKGLQDNLSPKRKGDWKDLTLMSLSFAVYVYMSQKIVCAYCAWMSMAGQPW